MDAGAPQVKEPADSIGDDACDGAASDRCTFGIFRVHGYHARVVFQHGRREHGGA